MPSSPSCGEAGRGCVVWLTGLPSSGKSTLAARARDRLRLLSRPVVVLDGDAVRAAIVPAPTYDREGREAFYATLARLAALVAGQGVVVLVPATAHRREFRAEARRLAPAFVEVHVDTPLAVCQSRDPKHLHAAARAGAIADLPGTGVAYEPPEHPDVRAVGGEDQDAVDAIVAWVASAIG